jgi:hypothetical protein
MHTNSQLAHETLRLDGTLSKRSALILRWLFAHPGLWTDRQIAAQLAMPDMNCVRPRITELVARHLLREVDSVRCPVTGKRVRRVTPFTGQTELPL